MYLPSLLKLMSLMEAMISEKNDLLPCDANQQQCTVQATSRQNPCGMAISDSRGKE
jgi:hypothetical protein